MFSHHAGQIDQFCVTEIKRVLGEPMHVSTPEQLQKAIWRYLKHVNCYKKSIVIILQ